MWRYNIDRMQSCSLSLVKSLFGPESDFNTSCLVVLYCHFCSLGWWCQKTDSKKSYLWKDCESPCFIYWNVKRCHHILSSNSSSEYSFKIRKNIVSTKMTYMMMVKAAKFQISKNWRQSKSPPIQVDKVWYMCSMEYCSVVHGLAL